MSGKLQQKTNSSLCQMNYYILFLNHKLTFYVHFVISRKWQILECVEFN